MKIIIVGAGTVGFQIAKHLIAEEKDVVLIEQEPGRYKNAANHLDCLVIHEPANDINVLKRAGIEKADFFITVTNSDEMNMILCAMVNAEFSTPCKIARIRNTCYAQTKMIQDKLLGMDYVVNPEIETAKVIANTVEHGAQSDVKKFQGTAVQIRNLVVEPESFFCGKSVQEIKQELQKDFLIIGIDRNETLIIPTGEMVIQNQDALYLIAHHETLDFIFTKAGRPHRKLSKVIVVGGGSIGSKVSRSMLKQRKSVTIVEQDYQLCKKLAGEFPKALVLNANITDESLFQEEQLEKHDLIITTTSDQELNIITAVYAKAIGIKRAIALVVNNNYLKIANRLGLDATVSPKISIVDTILTIIRSGNIRTIHSILGGSTEIIEFMIAEGSPVVGHALKKINLPPHSLIVSVTRDRKSYIPDGNFVIQATDDVIVITRKDSVPAIENIING